jgi:hypothetical protein
MNKRAVSWRTFWTELKYQAAIKQGSLKGDCVFCSVNSIKDFEYWKIVPNKYPYNRVSKVHDIIYPIRHTDGGDLTTDEINELVELKKDYLNTNYQYILEAMPKNKSIPGHFHLHLIIAK